MYIIKYNAQSGCMNNDKQKGFVNQINKHKSFCVHVIFNNKHKAECNLCFPKLILSGNFCIPTNVRLKFCRSSNSCHKF